MFDDRSIPIPVGAGYFGRAPVAPVELHELPSEVPHDARALEPAA